MNIFQYSLGQMKANCYLLVESDKCIIIDPGDEAEFILEQIRRKRLIPLAILATHGHFDHVMATGEIQLSYKVPFYITKEDMFLIGRTDKTAQYFLKYNPKIVKPDAVNYLTASKMKIGPPVSGFQFEVLRTPGHTPGSCCYYFEKEQTVFTGDIIFKDGIGRYDFSYSNKIELFESIKKIMSLPEETIIYPGHGGETTVLSARSELSFQ